MSGIQGKQFDQKAPREGGKEPLLVAAREAVEDQAWNEFETGVRASLSPRVSWLSRLGDSSYWDDLQRQGPGGTLCPRPQLGERLSQRVSNAIRFVLQEDYPGKQPWSWEERQLGGWGRVTG